MELDYFLVADKRFYEPIDRQPVNADDYLNFIQSRISGSWKLVRKGVWINCLNRGSHAPAQGWKIHVSSVPRDSRKLLEVVAAYLIPRKISFKFLGDVQTLRMTNAKAWTRGGSGKFITIYPSGEAQFRQVLQDLEPLLKDFRGPYILSDRRYKDSKVLYYRYGGLTLTSRLQADGSALAVLVSPDGREMEDERGPSFRLPDWVSDPFPREDETKAGDSLNNGRYTVEKALQFSNTGGVYVALDAVSGRRVILKEARAHIHSFSDETDAAAMLRHEYDILKRVQDCGAAPRPIELFKEWEHTFLAEEFLEDYIPLRKFSAQGSVGLETRPTRESVAGHIERDLGIVRKLSGILDALHERGVVWGDVSVNNILIHPETLDVRIIDLESARVTGDDSLPRIVTRGFADKKPSTAIAAVEDDYYGVGAILLFLITNANGLLGLKPQAGKDFLAEMTRDFGLPPELTRIIERLLDEDGSRRPRPAVALGEARLGIEHQGPALLAGQDWTLRCSREAMDALVKDACRFVKANADLHRQDRLFPADPLVYLTNPLSLAHGAAGILYALHKAEGAVAPEMTQWLLKTESAVQACPPGLYTGAAGVAWALLEMGRADQAQAVLAKAEESAVLRSSPDLYQGLAGWGLTQLKFWRKTGESSYLENAQKTGRALLETAQERDGGLFWTQKDGIVSYGLGHGAAGIALFLLSLDRALGGGRYERAAVRAMDFDMAQGLETAGGGLSWRRTEEDRRVVFPYWRAGSAGVGVAALRFLVAFKDARYRELIEKIYLDCDRKYTVFAGRNEGLAGLGEFHLDAYAKTGDKKFLNSAWKAAAGLKLFCVQDRQGTAFPGNGLTRLSCDLGTGSAGVILFLDRLNRPRPTDFMLDEVLS